MRVVEGVELSTPVLMVVALGDAQSGDDTVVVEADAPTGMVRVARPDEIVGRAAESLMDSMRRVRRVAETIVEEVSRMPRQPEQLTVQFGVKLGGEAGAVIVKATGEANFLFTLGWGRASAQAATPQA
jgi:hypothetical protein